MTKKSVCIAMYNGSSFIKEQIHSILEQLSPVDELIICDDASTDDSLSVVLSISDARIKLLTNTRNRGHIKTFERAINHSSGDIIFISDQDDIWLPGRVDNMSSMLDYRLLVITSFDLIGLEVPTSHPITSFHPSAEMDKMAMRNLIGIFLGKRSYFGCAMAFRRPLIQYIIPFPSYVECYDLWIATVALFLDSCVHSPTKTLLHRIHSSNLSYNRRSLFPKIYSRLVTLVMFAGAIKRIARFKSLPGSVSIHSSEF